MKDFIFPKVFAEIDIYNSELLQKECNINWTIIHFTPIKKDNCVVVYDTIIRDDNYTYYQIVVQENKPYYRDLSWTKAKEISCSWAYSDLWNSINPKVWDKYYFEIKGLYNEYYNYAEKVSKSKYSSWNNLHKCDWNIIDKAIIKSEEKDNITINSNYLLFFWALVLFIIVYLIYRNLKIKK